MEFNGKYLKFKQWLCIILKQFPKLFFQSQLQLIIWLKLNRQFQMNS